MCYFITEVTKLNICSNYPCQSLCQMCFIKQEKISKWYGTPWKFIAGGEFSQFVAVINNIMKQRAGNNIAKIKC